MANILNSPGRLCRGRRIGPSWANMRKAMAKSVDFNQPVRLQRIGGRVETALRKPDAVLYLIILTENAARRKSTV